MDHTHKNHEDSIWPQATAENRPWTRWWWLGGAVDRQTITDLIKTYSAAGLGGVEITSIYGVKGQEVRNIDYLSPTWIDMVRHAVAEAHRYGMKVDLPPGSGWRIGGDFLTDDTAAAQLLIEKENTSSGYKAKCQPSGEQVKRAGPGGMGPAFNPFSRASLQAVVDHFTPCFKGLGIRAQFHDSWEYNSDCCPEFFDRFRRMRGYDLREHLAALAGAGDAELVARVRYDAQFTLAELALDDFIVPWTAWCHELNQLSRNQAHDSPGNLLDLYAAADIPETEVFGSVTADTPLISKFASSAAHVTGKPLVSSETGTWTGEHFCVTLAMLKLLVDNLFVSGINHHVYHGTAYSPPDAEWPGWLFYAATQLNPRNTIWRDIGTLNAYVTRCQSMLQNGQPDNDLLVYFPIHDVLHDPQRKLAEKLKINGHWLKGLTAADTFRHLWRRGYSFDYISDRQLAEIEVDGRALMTPGGAYRALVIPPCRYLPVATLEKLIGLSRQGGNIVFLAPRPSDVPGLTDLQSRRSRFDLLMNKVESSPDIQLTLSGLGIRREHMADVPGLLFIRRRHDSGHDYFVANQGVEPIDVWIRLAVAFTSVLIMDPLSGRAGVAQTREKEVRVQLEPGASLILRVFKGDAGYAGAWTYVGSDTPRHTLLGVWSVEFIEGGPVLPPGYTTDTLFSWTDRGGAAERFAGTARYRLRFNAPSPQAVWLLDLGVVHSSARVRLNGEEMGALIGPSFQTMLHGVKQTGNVLEIEVTNLAANRIRDLDRRGVEWKIFEDINFVNREYQPFDASGWPIMPAGLLGPVKLISPGGSTYGKHSASSVGFSRRGVI